MPKWSSLSFQDSVSPIMEQILFFNDHSMIVLILITILISYMLTYLSLMRNFNKFISEGQEIETIWTILPLFLLMFISFPSFKTLYLMEDTKNPSLTLKIIGHQWYWSYEFSSLNCSEVEGFMDESNLIRLLKTSNLLMLPVSTLIRGVITSNDVIHSWAIPSLGLKMDAIPGRLNQVFFISKRIGLFTGQCSEICGVNHSFMPITILFLGGKEFISNFIK